MEPIQVVITFDPRTGKCNVSAPQDKIVAYGLLGMAHEAIASRAKEEPSKVIRPVAVVPDLVGR